MKKSAMQYNAKHSKLLLVIEILISVAIFIPWLSVSDKIDGNVSFTGLGLLAKFSSHSGWNNLSGYHWFAIIMILPVLLMVVAAFSNLLKIKIAKDVAAASFIISSVATVIMLLCTKKLVDGSGILKTPIMVTNLSFGFWMFFILSFIGLAFSFKARKTSRGYIILVILSVIWLFPIAWIVLTSFRTETGFYTPYFIPQHFTLMNYVKVITDTKLFYYGQWYINTLIVAGFSCIISTLIILCTSYVISRLRFRGRKSLFNMLLILGMFPNFMAVFAVYFIVKGMGLNGSLVALILVYSGGAAVGLLITKGFYDTIPASIEEAAYLDGATKWKVFTKIILPLSKPIIIYSILLQFIASSSDVLSSSVMLGDNYHKFTLAVGMYEMLQRATIDVWFTRFAAGSVLIAIPICLLFIFLQKYYVNGISGSVKG